MQVPPDTGVGGPTVLPSESRSLIAQIPNQESKYTEASKVHFDSRTDVEDWWFDEVRGGTMQGLGPALTRQT